MKATSHLHKLIHSLTMSEKRHFKIFASRHVIGKKNKYIILFDEIAAQKEYDEEKLKGSLKEKVTLHFLSEAKNYLTELILKSLEQYHTNDIDVKIRSLIHQIEILFSKNQFELCFKAVQKARSIAFKYERQSYIIEILRLEFEINRAMSYVQKTEEEIVELFTESQRQVEQMQNSIEYRKLAAKLFMRLSRYGFTPEEEKIDYITRLMNNELFRDESLAKTYISNYSFYHCHTAYYFIKNDYKRAYGYVKKLSQLIENNFHQVAERPRQYITTMNNVIVCEMALKKYKELEKTIQKLRAYNCRSTDAKQETLYLSNITELELYINTGQFERGVKLIPEIEQTFARQFFDSSNLQYIHTLNFAIAIILFGAGQHKATLKYLNKILNESSSNIRSDIYSYAKLLTLILYIEMGKQDLLEYAVRSAYRYFYKHKNLNEFESLILEFIRKKIPRSRSENELTETFKELRNSLRKLQKDPAAKNSLRFFDIITWLESKIKKRSFADLVKEKANK